MATAAAALLILPTQAEDCGPLTILSTIPLTHIDGLASDFVPVEIAGVPKLLVLDTGASFNVISNATVNELHLNTTPATIKLVDATGGVTDRLVSTKFKIGTMQGNDIQFMVSPSSQDDFGDSRVVGLLGASILSHYDVSIDFGAHTLALLNPNHCEGKVLYWPERPVAVIPFKFKNASQIILHVTLDGKDVVAQLDTGASGSTLERKKAERSFDVVVGSTDTPAVGNLNGAEGLTMWTHRFKSLSLAGLEVANPEFYIIPDKISEKLNSYATGSLLDQKANSTEEPLMLLGMNVLKQLRVYIAYKEKKLYISPASKPAASPAVVAPTAKTN